jgi:hypothetical protein
MGRFSRKSSPALSLLNLGFPNPGMTSPYSSAAIGTRNLAMACHGRKGNHRHRLGLYVAIQPGKSEGLRVRSQPLRFGR